MSEVQPVPTEADVAELVDTIVERRLVSSERAFDGRVLSVRTDVVDLGDGHQVRRDVVVHPGAVGIIAVDDELRVLLLRQYRHPVGALLWEAPAGLLDVPGEDPFDAAARELFEEAGYRARVWSVLVDAFVSPGGSDEAVRIYLARDLREVDEDDRHVREDEERDMPIRWVPLREAREAVFAGRVHNTLAILGILAASAVLLDEGGRSSQLRAPHAPWLRNRTGPP